MKHQRKAPEGYYTMAETADKLCCTTAAIRHMIAKGDLEHIHPTPRRMFVPIAAVTARLTPTGGAK